MDFQSIQTAALSADPGAAQKQTKVFSAKMTLPFDAYSKTLTPEKLQADLAKYSQNLPVLPIPNEHANRNWFLALLVRSLLSVVNLFSRPPNPSFDLAQDFSHIELSWIKYWLFLRLLGVLMHANLIRSYYAMLLLFGLIYLDCSLK